MRSQIVSENNDLNMNLETKIINEHDGDVEQQIKQIKVENHDEIEIVYKVESFDDASVNDQLKPKTIVHTDNNFEGISDIKIEEIDEVDGNRPEIGGKPYTCDVCSKSFNRKYILQRHGLTHTGEKPYACDFCPKSYGQKVTLTMHLLTHTGEKNYTCDLCSKSFHRKDILTKHLLTHTREKHTSQTVEKPYTCEVCSKSFVERRNLDLHRKIHASERYTCDFCSKSFNRKRTLKRHRLTHTGEKNYTCDLCLKLFYRKDVLTKHLLTHTREKSTSDFYSKSFAEEVAVLNHMPSHTVEKPYTCEVCSKSFVQIQNLEANIFRHWKLFEAF